MRKVLKRKYLFVLPIMLFGGIAMFAQTPLFSPSFSKLIDGEADFMDIDGDGDLDIMISGQTNIGSTTEIWKYNGTQFNLFSSSLPTLTSSTFDWADMDADGDLDLVLCGSESAYSQVCKVYRNGGTGTLTQVTELSTGIEQGHVKWGDFDGDGNIDILAAGYNVRENVTATIYKKLNDSTFTQWVDPIVLTGWMDAAVGDFSGDGKQDLVVTGYDEDNMPSTISRLGISSTGIPTPNLFDARLFLVDLDGNGNLELIQSGVRDGQVENHAYDWTGTAWALRADTLPPWQIMDMDGALVNGDTLPDLLICGVNPSGVGQTEIFLRAGSSYTAYGANLPAAESGVQYGDFDNDGDNDLLLFGPSPSGAILTRIYRNSSGTFVYFQ
jgi:hypothetical protein